MNKKSFILGAALSAVLFFAACGDDSSSTSANSEPSEDVTLSSSDKALSSSSEKVVSSSSVKNASGDEKSSSSEKAVEATSSSNEKTNDEESSSSEKAAEESSSSAEEVSSSSETTSPATESSSSETVPRSSESCIGDCEPHFDWNLPKEAYLNPDIKYDSIKDARDGQIYKIVKIGKQWWMAQNLNYADSAKTPSLKGNSWCYGNVAEHCDVTGRLYTGTVALEVCPEKWHLPSRDEWDALRSYVGGLDSAGISLKSQRGWYGDGNGNDKYGFSAIPGSMRSQGGGGDVFGDRYPDEYLGLEAWFWTSEETMANFLMTGVALWHDRSGIYASENGFKEHDGFSVRCLKDAE